MRIGIDARFLTHPQVGGFKTYTENLVSALARVDSDNQYFLYLDRQPDQNTKLPDASNMTCRVVPGQADMVGMVWREQVDLPRQVSKDKLDLMHSPCLTAPFYTGCASVVTIHDMIWYAPNEFTGVDNRLRSLRRKLQDGYFRAVSAYAARRASRIITVSQSSKKDIVRLLGLPPDKVFVTYEAAGMEYRLVTDEQQIESVRKKFGLPSKFILSLGSSDPRKNIQTLLESYALLPVSLRESYQLVVVWCHGSLASTMEHRAAGLGLENQVRFLKGVQNEDLILLYNAASLLVFPSIYEGFGLPLLEAMTCGTPVVASNNSCIPEIVERAALLADAKDAKAMARVISVVLIDELLRKKLISKGHKRVTTFSWNKCALETIDVYKQVVSARRSSQMSIKPSQASEVY